MSTRPNDHVSELLRAHARGELTAADRDRVAAHLERCADCRTELIGVRALVGPDPDGLSELERERLHRGLQQRLRAESPVEPSRSRTGLYAALSAAAVVVVLAVGGLYGLTSTEDEGGSASSAQERAADQGQGGLAAENSFAGEGPIFETAVGELDQESLRRTGSRGAVVAVAAGKTVADADRLQDRYLRVLQEQAPDELSGRIEECAGIVLGANADFTLLPAYGATGTVEDRDAFALGFAWSRAAAGPLDNYMLYAWPAQGGCDIPLSYQAGELAR